MAVSTEPESELPMPHWWESLPEERYWVEIRTIPGIGEEVYSETLNAKNRPDPHWELVRTLRTGQVVFHYDADQSRFVGFSTVAADARTVSGKYRAPLVNFTVIKDEIGLARLREVADELFEIRDRMLADIRTPLFLPFQFTQNRSQFRMLSNYFAKLPVAVIEAIFGPDFTGGIETQPAPGGEAPEVVSAGGFLKPFKPKADTVYRTMIPESVTDRSRSHETLVNDCSIWLASLGFEVGRNSAIDLGIMDPAVIIEAKTVGLSWPLAVRAGIAQLYEYRYFKAGPRDAQLILLVDVEPPPKWLKYLERDRDIGVVWRSDDGFAMSRLATRIIHRPPSSRRR